MREIFDPASGQRVPIRVWARAISPQTERQLQTIARQPYVVEHVAAMADAHVAEGVAVGTVFATEHAVVPAALGADLGCGMAAVRIQTDAHRLDRHALERIVDALGRAIPAGDALHRGAGATVDDRLLAPPLSTHALERTRSAMARKHLGTLGGGNHFIELDRDADGALWLLVHSGSRGLGGAVATHHAHAARARDPSPLAAMDTREPAGAAYIDDAAWAFAFARANRESLTSRALDVLYDQLGEAPASTAVLDVHHNFVARERWNGRDLVVHRKGAIAAPAGALALVPGSMGTASYVVRGLGNEAAFGSCSHGAGRVLSRGDARRAITPSALERAMRRVVFPPKLTRRLVEEAPAAYRDIAEVLDDQRDLVERHVRLEPIAVLKG
jgi:tRNA-splicing ligase RtcB